MGKRENCAGQASLVICQTEKLVNHESSWIGSLNLFKVHLNNLYWYLNEVCRPGIGPWHECETSDLKRLWKSQVSRLIVDIHNIPIQEASLQDYSINRIFNQIVQGQSVARHPGEWASERTQRLFVTRRCRKSNTSANELKPWLRASERMQKERKNASHKKPWWVIRRIFLGAKNNWLSPWGEEKIDNAVWRKSPCRRNEINSSREQRKIDYHHEAKRNRYCCEAWIAVRRNEIDSCREAEKKLIIAMRQRENWYCREARIAVRWNEINSCREAKKNRLSPWGEEKIDNAMMGRESP